MNYIISLFWMYMYIWGILNPFEERHATFLGVQIQKPLEVKNSELLLLTFLFVSLSYTAESAIVTAFITFIPKFIESQFGIPASNASIYTGKALPLELLETMIISDH